MPRPPPTLTIAGVQSSSARAFTQSRASSSIAAVAAVASATCEPRCTCRPSISSPARRACSNTSRASSGGTPNFEPTWPVRIFSWVSASTPGVIRRSTRLTPAAAQRSTSPGSSMTTSHASASAAAASSSSDLLFPCTTSTEGEMPAACANRSSPSVDTSAPIPSSARMRISATFGKRLRPVDDRCVGRTAPPGARGRTNGLLAVDDQRRAVLLCERGRAHAADRQFAVLDPRRIGEQLQHQRARYPLPESQWSVPPLLGSGASRPEIVTPFAVDGGQIATYRA